jgi:hypothetical protein
VLAVWRIHHPFLLAEAAAALPVVKDGKAETVSGGLGIIWRIWAMLAIARAIWRLSRTDLTVAAIWRVSLSMTTRSLAA